MRPATGLALLAAGLALAVPLGAAELDQHGGSHEWREPRGRLTVVDFAASWCAPCRRTLPRLEAFARRHPEVRVLVVSVDERREGRDQLVASLGLTLPVVWDEGHEIAKHYAPQAMPATFVVSPQGEVVLAVSGSRERDWARLVRYVEEAAGAGRD